MALTPVTGRPFCRLQLRQLYCRRSLAGSRANAPTGSNRLRNDAPAPKAIRRHRRLLNRWAANGFISSNSKFTPCAGLRPGGIHAFPKQAGPAPVVALRTVEWAIPE